MLALVCPENVNVSLISTVGKASCCVSVADALHAAVHSTLAARSLLLSLLQVGRLSPRDATPARKPARFRTSELPYRAATG